MKLSLSIDAFEEQLFRDLRKYLQGGNLEIIEKNNVRLKARYHVGVSLFIDVFYATRTRKISFAVIQNGDRVFGIDNLGFWHCHPFRNPQKHEPIETPSIEEIVSQCKLAINALTTAVGAPS